MIGFVRIRFEIVIELDGDFTMKRLTITFNGTIYIISKRNYNAYITTPACGHPFLKRRGVFATALVVRKTELISNRKFDKYL